MRSREGESPPPAGGSFSPIIIAERKVNVKMKRKMLIFTGAALTVLALATQNKLFAIPLFGISVAMIADIIFTLAGHKED